MDIWLKVTIPQLIGLSYLCKLRDKLGDKDRGILPISNATTPHGNWPQRKRCTGTSHLLPRTSDATLAHVDPRVLHLIPQSSSTFSQVQSPVIHGCHPIIDVALLPTRRGAHLHSTLMVNPRRRTTRRIRISVKASAEALWKTHAALQGSQPCGAAPFFNHATAVSPSHVLRHPVLRSLQPITFDKRR